MGYLTKPWGFPYPGVQGREEIVMEVSCTSPARFDLQKCMHVDEANLCINHNFTTPYPCSSIKDIYVITGFGLAEHITF